MKRKVCHIAANFLQKRFVLSSTKSHSLSPASDYYGFYTPVMHLDQPQSAENTSTYLPLGTQLDEITLGVRVARGRAPPHLPGDGGVGDGEAKLRHQERKQEDEDGVGASVTVV